MNPRTIYAAAALGICFAIAGCGQAPVRPSDAHLRGPEPAPAGNIPPPVQVSPILPKPQPVARPETYSVVVNNVRAQDLLFALARDARLNIDIHPDISGSVTLNAIDQTLPQILNRISRQIDMRYEMDGPNLVIVRDLPFLRSYKIDYLSAVRNVKMQSTSNTQFASSSASGGGGGGGGGGTGATAQIDVNSDNRLWDSIVTNIREILQETDRILPGAASGGQPAAAAQPPAAAAPSGQAQSAAPGAAATAPVAGTPPGATFREAASVIANRETGVLYVRATTKQHEKVQEFLDQVISNARRQVLIEATVAEVQLNNQYQRGIDWSRLRTGTSGISIGQSSAGTPAGVDTSAFIVGYATAGLNFTSAVRLLESFGNVKVLSSPKLSVLNNQTALLRVTRDIVYFTMTASTTPVAAAGSGTVVAPATFNTTANVAAEGFMMSVLPQINEADAVVLNVRPTIRRRVADASDPNPALTRPNLIPVFETREFDSILRVQSGQIAVLGGLMQDAATTIEDMIPGVRDIPGFGQLLAQRRDTNTKTELVIFLRATVIRDPAIEGDFRDFREFMPGQDFLTRPNPARSVPSMPPR